MKKVLVSVVLSGFIASGLGVSAAHAQSPDELLEDCIGYIQENPTLGPYGCLADILTVVNEVLDEAEATLYSYDWPTNGPALYDFLLSRYGEIYDAHELAALALGLASSGGAAVLEIAQPAANEQSAVIDEHVDGVLLLFLEDQTGAQITSTADFAFGTTCGLMSSTSAPTTQYCGGKAGNRTLSPEERACAREPYDCYRARNADNDAVAAQKRKYPNARGVNDKADAFRHCTWSALMTKRANAGFAERMGNAHEENSTSQAETDMDQYNNAIGRQVGQNGEDEDDEWIYTRCYNKAQNGTLPTSP